MNLEVLLLRGKNLINIWSHSGAQANVVRAYEISHPQGGPKCHNDSKSQRNSINNQICKELHVSLSFLPSFLHDHFYLDSCNVVGEFEII